MMRSRDRDQQLAEYVSELDRVSANVAAQRQRQYGITCTGCQFFIRDACNPDAGMGACKLEHGYHYPNVRHRCADHQEATA